MEGSMRIETSFAGPSTAKQDVTLYASVEMGSTGWLVTSRSSGEDKMRRTRVAANDWRALVAALHRQQKMLAAQRLVCCYEAGREGFWPHRALQAAGIEAAVLDPASIAVNQRGRRTKTDRVDGEIELDAIGRSAWAGGRRRGWWWCRARSRSKRANRDARAAGW
jgi:transposase